MKKLINQPGNVVREMLEGITLGNRDLTLLPGDAIMTGTPSGVGPIRPGDEVEVEIEGIGVLRNPVVAESL